MLKRKYRIDFRAQKPSLKPADEKTIKTPFYFLRVRENNLPYSRFGVRVTKRIDKKAVVRNKAKRKIIMCVEKMRLEIKEGYDMLFVLKKEALTVDRENLCLLIRKVLKKEDYLK